jgi:serine/threonine-protein kinase HipA
MRAVEVFLHEAAEPQLVGVLRPSFQGDVLASSSFEYDSTYLATGYALSPDLPLQPGRLWAPESATLFGAFADASPDEWGQRIIHAARARAAKAEGVRPGRISEFDYLLGVSDFTRMGALRLRPTGSEAWLSSDDGVANLHDLPRILSAARRYEAHEATDEDLAYLNGVATSPGGARPKVNVRLDDGRLALAKLPHSKDGDIDVERWEAVALTLAADSGIRVPAFTVEAGVGRKAVLVLERFDRGVGGARFGYISAATAMSLGAHRSGAELTYLDLADTVAELVTSPRGELHQLFRRIALTIFVNNVDDHWRNHGFLRSDSGWMLSPVFDVNPSPQHGVLNSRLVSDRSVPGERRIEDLLDAADAFELRPVDAANIAASVATIVDRWAAVAGALGVAEAEIRAMAPSFDTEQREHAQAAAAAANPAAVIDVGARAGTRRGETTEKSNGDDTRLPPVH